MENIPNIETRKTKKEKRSVLVVLIFLQVIKIYIHYILSPYSFSEATSFDPSRSIIIFSPFVFTTGTRQGRRIHIA